MQHQWLQPSAWGPCNFFSSSLFSVVACCKGQYVSQRVTRLEFRSGFSPDWSLLKGDRHQLIDKISSAWAWVLAVSQGICLYTTYCLLSATGSNLGRGSCWFHFAKDHPALPQRKSRLVANATCSTLGKSVCWIWVSWGVTAPGPDEGKDSSWCWQSAQSKGFPLELGQADKFMQNFSTHHNSLSGDLLSYWILLCCSLSCCNHWFWVKEDVSDSNSHTIGTTAKLWCVWSTGMLI